VRKAVALLLLLGLSIALGQEALAGEVRADGVTSLSATAPPEELWIQPSSDSRDLGRPPERQPFWRLPSGWAPPSAGAEVDPALHRGRGASPPGPGNAPSRRLLHHRSSSSSADGQPA
jgi:hypothetical protein